MKLNPKWPFYDIVFISHDPRILMNPLPSHYRSAVNRLKVGWTVTSLRIHYLQKSSPHSIGKITWHSSIPTIVIVEKYKNRKPDSHSPTFLLLWSSLCEVEVLQIDYLLPVLMVKKLQSSTSTQAFLNGEVISWNKRKKGKSEDATFFSMLPMFTLESLSTTSLKSRVNNSIVE